MTLGGVADRYEVQSLLQKTLFPIDWLNFWSENDKVLRYVLKLWDGSISPIGIDGISSVVGHSVSSIDVT